MWPSNVDVGWAYGAETAINSVAGVDGTTTAATITAPASSALVGPYKTAITVTASTVYTWSVWVKLGTMVAADYKFAVYDTTNSTWIGLNIVPTVTPVNYEWRRISYTFTTNAGQGVARPYMYRNDSTGAGGTVYVWGCQLELGSYPTSYIPTVGSAATRAADTFSVATTTRLADIVTLTAANWFVPSQGTWICDFDSSNVMNTPFVVKGDTAEFATARSFSNAGTWNGSTAVNADSPNMDNRIGTSYGLAYDQTGRTVTANGYPPTYGAGAFSNSSVVYLGSEGSGSRSMDGHMKRVVFFPYPVSNTQLQALTRV